MPAPIRAADTWLTAYAAGEGDPMLAATVPEDRTALEAALRAPPTSRVALALPPRPVEHRIIEVADRGPDWQIVALELTIENPLPSASRKIGAPMAGIPETRSVRQRLRVENYGGDAWGVKLDLDQVLKRARFAEELLLLIAEGQLTEVRARLESEIPEPPRDGHRGSSEAPRPDRLLEELERRLEEAEKLARSSTVSGP
ncbi:MAG: hypothetical protein AAFU79_03605 [Myxococcota bacterium]